MNQEIKEHIKQNMAEHRRRHLEGFRAKFAGSSTVGERGQIVIPADVREELGINPGDKIVFMHRHNVVCLIKADQLHGFMEKLAQKFGMSPDEIIQPEAEIDNSNAGN